jgi:uncharacterized protein (UPF0332 family)
MPIDKAKESLQAAELCYAHKLYNSTANRAYYAMWKANRGAGSWESEGSRGTLEPC